VTDLHVSLVSERSLLSETSSKQLYIHGSVISSNELKKVPPTTCPYYISGTCIPGDFDLPGQRYGFSTLIDNTGKTSLNTRVSTDYPKVPIVFEPESRLMQNPPPLMLK
jgi:hypothetical protein